MYLAFFGLAEKPFAITPDPRYLYLSARHADALAHLVYGINEAGGFIQLTGEVGTGKTTTIRSLLARAPKNADIALILNPRLSATDFLGTLCEELGLGTSDGDSADASTKALVDQLNRYLLRTHAQGRRVVLIVDEAQNLAWDVLEQIRLLTNLETETQKLLQIILIGQPELRTLLAREDLRQLAQRITGRYHLDPLSREETAAYVRHRLRVAGATSDIFNRRALRAIYRVSGGVPRVINIISDRALLAAYTQDLHQVPPTLVYRAGAEVFGQQLTPRWMPLLIGGLALAVLVGSAVLLVPHALGWISGDRIHKVAAAPAGTAVSPAAPSAAGAAPVAAGTAPVTAVAAPATAGSALVGAGAAPVAAGSTAAPAPSASATAPTLPQLFAKYHDSTDADSAFAQLLALWKAKYSTGNTDGCSQALAQGLQCLVQRGSLAQLRLLNRPAILMLSDNTGMPYQVVLRELRDDTAQLQFGTQTASVNIAELTRYWFGDFVLLWRPATKNVLDLSAGMRGTQVQRLRQQLDRWRGADGSSPGSPHASDDEYDASLVQLVEQFQRANRLVVDGIAGVATQVALDSALAAPDTPVLQPHPAQQASTRGS